MFEDGLDIRALLAKAEQARGHAKQLSDARAVKALNDYANELEYKVVALREKRNPKEPTTLREQVADAPTDEPLTGPELITAMKPPEAAESENGPPHMEDK